MIDEKLLIEELNRTKEAILAQGDPFLAAIMNRAISIVKNQHSVDAVEVVRCKDCKHYRNHPNGLCYVNTEPYGNEKGYKGEAVCVEPDDFCSYGERNVNDG